MDFDITYNTVIKVIRFRLSKTSKTEIAEDFVNAAYVDIIEKNLPLNKKTWVDKATRLMHSSTVGRLLNKREFSRRTTKVCGGCKNDTPIGYFGVTKNSFAGRRTIQFYCRDCQREKFREWWQDRKDKWNKKLRDRYRKEKAELHDNYIKKILRCYGWKTEDITPQVISYKRKEIQAKCPLSTPASSATATT